MNYGPLIAAKNTIPNISTFSNLAKFQLSTVGLYCLFPGQAEHTIDCTVHWGESERFQRFLSIQVYASVSYLYQLKNMHFFLFLIILVKVISQKMAFS